jgi:hypothetical protein
VNASTFPFLKVSIFYFDWIATTDFIILGQPKVEIYFYISSWPDCMSHRRVEHKWLNMEQKTVK